MALRRVFVDEATAGRAAASGPRAHHLARVVRLKPGEDLEVSDGSQAWRAVVESVSSREVVFALHEPLPVPEPSPRCELYLSLIKFPRFEWALEKATELGVARIIPVAAERCDGSLIRAAPKRVERWERIVEEAAQQSRRLKGPVVSPVATLSEALSQSAGVRFLVDFGGGDFSIDALRTLNTSGTAAVFVGPEGGWTAIEQDAARTAGALPVGLGPQVLRAETAAIAALSNLGQSLRAIE